MAGIDLATAETRLQQYLDAEAAVLSNQSYKIGDREYRRADLGEIRAGIDVWDKRCKSAAVSASGRSRSRTVVVRA